MDNKIKLQHGDGGKLTNELIENLFYKSFGNNILLKGLDSGIFPIEKGKMAFTTDSFVVKPIFFRGGDIGKLAICGTINDLVVSGAKPLYLSTAFIIEEGFSMESLKEIVNSMVDTCNNTGVKIITGDTKVVPKGSVDGLYINTSGIGIVDEEFNMGGIEEDDEILITGSIGDHGTSIAIDRYELSVQGNLESDCAPLNKVLENLEEYFPYIKLMKDPTRGGLGTILNEISKFTSLSIHIFEEKIPIRREVKGVCDILGLDPMYMACEGRMVIVVKKEYAKKVLEKLRILEEGKEAEIIGHFTCEKTRTVYRLVQHKDSEEVLLIQPDTKKDLTKSMNEFSEEFLKNLQDVDGFILKSRSPSCGIKEVKIYNGIEKAMCIKKGKGVFGEAVIDNFPYLPIEDEGRLKNYNIRQHFLTKIFLMRDFRGIEKEKSIESLIDFHSRNKLLLMSYNQKGLKNLGKILGNQKEHEVEETFNLYKETLGASLIRAPLYLIRSNAIRFNEENLLKQTFFQPYPIELEELTDSGKGAVK